MPCWQVLLLLLLLPPSPPANSAARQPLALALPQLSLPSPPFLLFKPGASASNSSYPGGYKGFRIPAIIAQGSSLVLAFAEGRQFGCECSTSPGEICSKDIVLRRCEQGSACVAASGPAHTNWSPLSAAVSAASLVDKRDGLWNPAPVYSAGGTLFVAFNRSPWRLNTEHDLEVNPHARETWIAKSTDNGLSFGAFKNLTATAQLPGWTWNSVSPGGSAIRLGGSGSMIIPGYHAENHEQALEGPFYGHHLASTDHGATWHLGGREAIGLDENQAVAMPGSTPCVGAICPGSDAFLLNARNDGNCTPQSSAPQCGVGSRVSIRSTDGGKSFTTRKLIDSLPEPDATCAGLSRWGGLVFFSNPCAHCCDLKPGQRCDLEHHSRTNLTLRMSTDDGASYSFGQRLHSGPGAYSSLAVVGHGTSAATVFCLAELPDEAHVSLIAVNVTMKLDDEAASEHSHVNDKQSPCAGTLLHNGICLPEDFPPKDGANLSDTRVRAPPYVQHPPDVINISTGRQLLAVDDFLIASPGKLRRMWHAVQYDEDINPVLTPTKGWEGNISMPFSSGAWFDEAAGAESSHAYKLFYNCGASKNMTCLAVSHDAKVWRKPVLPAATRKGTNIVREIEHYDTNVVWLDHTEHNKSRRWKMSEAACTYCDHSYGLLASADGISWELLVKRTGYVPDRSTIFHDPFRSRWIFSIKSAAKHKGQGRCRAYWESTDLFDARQANWTHDPLWITDCLVSKSGRVESCGEGIPRPWIGTDEGESHLAPPLTRTVSSFKPQLYNLDAVGYESLMVGAFNILQCKHSDDPTCPGSDSRHASRSTEFNSIFAGFSRDGWHWSRTDVPRHPLAGLSPDPDAWNYEDVQSTGGGFLVQDDILRFFFSGRRAGMTVDTTGTGTLRRDGFASLQTNSTSTITTRPLQWQAHLRLLFVNFRGERLRVGVHKQGETPIPDLSVASCVGLTDADSTRAEIRWHDAADLKAVASQVVQLEFEVTNGSLFSFWVSEDKCGASRGPLAAGGPGAVNGRDTKGSCRSKTDDEGQATVRRVPVMTAGASAVGCQSPGPCKYAAFRIPGLINTRNGTLVAVAEGRKFGCGDFDGQHDLVAARSTDHGRSWGPIQVLFDANFSWPSSKYYSQHSNAIWDPTPVFDRTTGETFVFFAGPGRTASDSTLGVSMLSSTDLGASWGPVHNLTTSCMRPGSNPHFNGGRSGDTPADGCGMQVSTGRLVIPMYAGLPSGASTCYSDTHGKSWNYSTQLLGGVLATEGEITELFPAAPGAPGAGAAVDSPPTLYYTIRNDKPHLPRQFATSTDLGDSWSNLTALTDVRDPDCKGGITRWEKGRALVLSHADSCSSRVNTTARLSTDNGVTFPFAQLIDPASGYSTVQMIGPTRDTIGVLYEQGGCSLVLGMVEASDVLAHGRIPPPPPPSPPPPTLPIIRPGSGPRLAIKMETPQQLGNTTHGPPCFLRPLLLRRGSTIVLQKSTSLSVPQTATWIKTPRAPPASGEKRAWANGAQVTAGAPTIELALTPREIVIDLENNLTVLANGSVHGPRLFVSADPLSESIENYTLIDLARHHDEAAQGEWWQGKWQFFSTANTQKVPGLCSEAGAPGHVMCQATGVVGMAATGPNSVLVCYDQRYCPFETGSSGVWCVDIVLDVGLKPPETAVNSRS